LTTDANSKPSLSVRNIQEDNQRSEPLRDFWGRFDDAIESPATGYDGTRVALSFSELDVKATAPGEVWNMPTYVIEVGLSNRPRSRWGYFAKSIAPLMPEDEDIATGGANNQGQKGKMMHLQLTDGQDGRPAGKPIYNKKMVGGEKYPDGNVPSPVWVVVEIEGGKGAVAPIANLRNHALELCVGKTKANYATALMSDVAVKNDPAFFKTITDKSFITTALQLKELVDVNGTYQKGEKFPKA
jgi:hypothetical protein